MVSDEIFLYVQNIVHIFVHIVICHESHNDLHPEETYEKVF
jgi:hypothetical protein